MSEQVLIFACLSMGMIAALLGGVFQSFSDFVMRALATSNVNGGLESMQRINVTVMRSWFLAGFVIVAPVSLSLAIYGALTLSGAAATALVMAGLVYLVGCFLLTLFGNVPMNNRLADLPLGQSASQDYWQHYLSHWTRLNTIRMAACMGTAALYLFAAVQLAGA